VNPIVWKIFLFFILFFALVSFSKASQEYDLLIEKNSAVDTGTQIISLKAHLAEHPENREGYLKLLQLYWQESRQDEALSFFLQQSDNETTNSNYKYALLWYYIYKRNTNKALSLIDNKLHAKEREIILVEIARLFADVQITQEIRFKLQNLFSTTEYSKLTHFILFFKRDYDTFLKNVSVPGRSIPLLDLKGTAFLATDNFPKAENLFRTGAQLANAQNSNPNHARFFIRQAKLNASRRNYKSSQTSLNNAKEYIPFVYDLYLLADFYSAQGLVAYNLGQHKQSIAATQKAIAISGSLNNRYLLIELYYNLGRASSLNEEYQKAFSSFKKSEAFAIEYNNVDKLFQLQASQTSLLYNLELYSLADIFSQDATQLAFLTERSNFIRMAKGRQAGIQFGLGNYEQAIKSTKDVLLSKDVLSPAEQAYWNSLVGRSYMFQSQYDSAQTYFENALSEIQASSQRDFYEGYYFYNLIELEIERKNFTKAENLLNSFLIDFNERSDTDLQIGHLLYTGIVHENLNDFDKAISALKKGIKIAESSQTDLSITEFRIGYLSSIHYLYESLSRIYYKKYKKHNNKSLLDSLYYYEEMSKSRVLKDDLFYKDLHDKAIKSGPYLDACNELFQKQMFIRNTSTMSRKSEEWIDIIADIEFSKINLLQQKLLSQPQKSSGDSSSDINPSLQLLFEKIKQQELGVLIYHVDEYESFVLVVSPDTVLVMDLDINVESIENRFDSLMQPFFQITSATTKTTNFRALVAHQLYEKLFKPIADSVDLPNSLLIIPSLNLSGLPFDLLLTQIPQKGSYFPVDPPDYAENFLLHKYSMFYSPTSLVLLTKEKETKNKSIAVFANPFTTTNVDYDPELQLRMRTGWSLMPLPFAGKEADEIKKIKRSAKIFKSDKATEQQFINQSGKFDILHIASHAFVDTMFDDFSGLVLAIGDSTQEDGILMGYEIKDLDLNCELVALSACETGRGGKIQGEGIMGMPRLFLGAGAKTVLMSLWKVDDRFTSQLIPQFYRHYLKEGLSKTQSLAMAKRGLLNSKGPYKGMYYQHPMFWASFAIYGNPGTATGGDGPHVIWFIFLLILCGGIVIIGILFKTRARKKLTD
jgi:CHAT domain-containing protein/tetratricopeptide (TPR) repeat protein